MIHQEIIVSEVMFWTEMWHECVFSPHSPLVHWRETVTSKFWSKCAV